MDETSGVPPHPSPTPSPTPGAAPAGASSQQQPSSSSNPNHSPLPGIPSVPSNGPHPSGGGGVNGGGLSGGSNVDSAPAPIYVPSHAHHATGELAFPSHPDAYEVGKKLSSRVKRAKYDGREYVVKTIVFDPSKSEAKARRVEDTLDYFLSLSHPNLLKTYHYFYYDRQLWIVEGCRGWEDDTIRNLLRAIEGKDFEDPSRFVAAAIKPVVQALAYLHASGRPWSDVRPRNIYVQSSGQILMNLVTLRSVLRERTRDSLLFVAPEIQKKDEVTGDDTQTLTSADIWSLGITLLYFANRTPPYSAPDLTPQQLSHRIVSEEVPSLDPQYKWPPEIEEFLSLCLQKSPGNRPTADELLRHPFITNAPDKDYIRQWLFSSSSPTSSSHTSPSPTRHAGGASMGGGGGGTGAGAGGAGGAAAAGGASGAGNVGSGTAVTSQPIAPQQQALSGSGGESYPSSASSHLSQHQSQPPQQIPLSNSSSQPLQLQTAPASQSTSSQQHQSSHAHTSSNGSVPPPSSNSSQSQPSTPNVARRVNEGASGQQQQPLHSSSSASVSGVHHGHTSHPRPSTMQQLSQTMNAGNGSATMSHSKGASPTSSHAGVGTTARTNRVPSTSVGVLHVPEPGPRVTMRESATGEGGVGGEGGEGGGSQDSSQLKNSDDELSECMQSVPGYLSHSPTFEEKNASSTMGTRNIRFVEVPPTSSLPPNDPPGEHTRRFVEVAPDSDYVERDDASDHDPTADHLSTSSAPDRIPLDGSSLDGSLLQAGIVDDDASSLGDRIDIRERELEELGGDAAGSDGETSSNASNGSPLRPSNARFDQRRGIQQITPSNIPVQTYLGETSDEFIVFLRTIPSTKVTLRLESKVLIIYGDLPPLNLDPSIQLVDKVQTHFEKRIYFSDDIDPNSFQKVLDKGSAMMTIQIRKFRHRDLGSDQF